MTSPMFLLFIVASFTCFITGKHIFEPCKLNDNECVLKSAKGAFSNLIAGIPEVGIEGSEPLHLELIDGNLSVLKYTLTDSIVSGLKKCKVDNFQLDIENEKLRIDLTCPQFDISGKYVIGGRLIILPVEGNGTYTIDTKTYKMSLEAETKKVPGKDGKDHLNIKNFKINVDAVEPVVFDFKNLFNGQKDLSDAVHKFANENWKEVTDFVQEPVFKTFFKKIIGHANKYLKTVPYEELFA